MTDERQCSCQDEWKKVDDKLTMYHIQVESMMKYSSNMIPPKLMLIIVGVIVLAFAGEKGLELVTIWSKKILGAV